MPSAAARPSLANGLSLRAVLAGWVAGIKAPTLANPGLVEWLPCWRPETSGWQEERGQEQDGSYNADTQGCEHALFSIWAPSLLATTQGMKEAIVPKNSQVFKLTTTFHEMRFRC